jgi:hypothetical protein
MTSRNPRFVRGAALFCASLSASFTVVAFGQTQAENAQPGAAPLGATNDKATAAGEPTAAQPKPESEQRQGEANDKPAADQQAAAARAPVAPPPMQTQAAVQVSSPPVVVEQLPTSAYLSPRTRGLRGGSLWLTLHGYQFPYLPVAPGKSGLRIALSGSAWVDTSYRKVDAGLEATTADKNLHDWRQQGRFVGRITPTFSTRDGWFAQAQGELVLNSSSDTGVSMHAENTDDLFVRIGKWHLLDITAGRFQGWEIYHFGMGLDLNTLERDGARSDGNQPPGIYGVTYLWDRMDGPGKVAAHLYPTDYLRFELQGVVGSNAANQMGVRPVAILDFGWVKLKVGAEYEKQTPRKQSPNFQGKVENRGLGGSLQFVVDPYVEFGVNAAQGLTDNYNDNGVLQTGLSETRTSLGGFANGRIYGPLLIGAGIHNTRSNNLNTNEQTGDHDVFTHLQAFGAIQYSFLESFYIKMVVAYADGHFNKLSDPPENRQDYHNQALSGRLRLMYLF